MGYIVKQDKLEIPQAMCTQSLKRFRGCAQRSRGSLVFSGQRIFWKEGWAERWSWGSKILSDLMRLRGDFMMSLLRPWITKGSEVVLCNIN